MGFDSSSGTHFTGSTFLPVDEACIDNKPRRTTVSCDDPDLSESKEDLTLRQQSVLIETAWEVLPALEVLMRRYAGSIS